MYSTKNDTTTVVGHAQATVLACSEHMGNKITTWELAYPRYIHSELMTHRMFSRNASSSRATPVKRTVEEVMNNPTFFDFVGKNKSGMVAEEPLDESTLESFRREWAMLGEYVAKRVMYWSEVYGIHKQTINRALEPWTYIRVIVTATETDNFFKLRLAPDAQPEIRSLAQAMQVSMEKARVDRDSKVHIPYGEYFDEDEPYRKIIRSVAACARVSVARNDNRKTTYEEDRNFVCGLAMDGHMTPFEHVAWALGDDEFHANLKGWMSLRWVIEHDCLSVALGSMLFPEDPRWKL